MYTWNWNIFTPEIPSSHVKCAGSKFQLWNQRVRNICFTYKIIILWKLISYMKFSFHTWNWNNSHMKYFQMWNCMWKFCKGSLEFFRIGSSFFSKNLFLAYFRQMSHPLILCLHEYYNFKEKSRYCEQL